MQPRPPAFSLAIYWLQKWAVVLWAGSHFDVSLLISGLFLHPPQFLPVKMSPGGVFGEDVSGGIMPGGAGLVDPPWSYAHVDPRVQGLTA